MTVLVGANGAGKTSILEAAIVMIGTIFSPMDGVGSYGFDKEDARRVVYMLGSGEDSQKMFPVEVEATGTIDEKNIFWKRALNSEKGRTTIKEAEDIIKIGEEYQSRLRKGDATLRLPIVVYYGTGRLWDYHKEKNSDIFKNNTRTNGYINCLDGTANVKLMMNWFKKMTIIQYQRRENNEGETPELHVVYKAMADCLKSVSNYEDVNIRYNLNTNELDVVYVENGKKNKLPLSLMSDGYKSTISLVADIAYRMTILNPQLGDEVLEKTDGIILIDEVDLHLHPLWQQNILEDLSSIFPKVQFIVSTHAPEIINTAKKENICILKQDMVDRPAIETYGKDANAVLKSVMKVTERPVSVKENFQEFYDAMAKEEYEMAEQILQNIENEIGTDDPELVSCWVKLDLANM